MDKRTNGLKHLLAKATLAALVFAVPLFVGQTALAIDNSQWRPGRIIDDAVFYDGNSMTAGQIQTFLNSKVPSCDTNGTKQYGNTGMTRAQWAAANNQPQPPYICLRNHSQTTSNKSSDGFCNGHTAGNKSAAQILYEVAQSCGVSAKALIVLLQKEQSLITDDWPWPAQYNKATGFFCPDDPHNPGWCHPDYAGFFNQVYHAARQFKVYQAYPHNYNHIPNANNNIRFHPNAACGSSSVFIENQATAGLYNYTPYQPNQARLNNNPDGCSSNGNLNFWRIYWDWFGNPGGPQYAWRLESYRVFSNPERTQRISDHYGVTYLTPGQTAYVRVQAQNFGRVNWAQNHVRLGTSGPKDRISPFRNDSWISGGRVVHPNSNINAGDTGTFEFSITAPSSPGIHTEHFGLVRDGVAWFHGNDLALPLVISEPPAANASTRNALTPGDSTLHAGERLTSQDRNSVLWLQPNGNLVLTVDFRVAWSSNTAGQGATRATLQGDGNLVLYRTSGQAVWASGTNGNGASTLSVQGDGNLVLRRNSDNQPTWASGSPRFGSLEARANYSLRPGDRIMPGQSAQTPDRKHRLFYQSDGNLVLYSQNQALWSTGTHGTTPGQVVMQSDGNMVLYDQQGNARWSSRTNGLSGLQLQMRMNGNAILGRGHTAWSTATANPNSYNGEFYLNRSANLLPGQILRSVNGNFRLAMQGDGNLVLYSPNRAIWASGTPGGGNARLSMQGDGNLVLYRNGSPVWSSRTSGRSGATLAVQNDGNVVIYQNGRAVWSTGTNGKW